MSLIHPTNIECFLFANTLLGAGLQQCVDHSSCPPGADSLLEDKPQLMQELVSENCDKY